MKAASLRVALLLAGVLQVLPLGRAQVPTDERGERLAASSFGPSAIETVAEMIRRPDRAASSGRLFGRSYREKPGTWFIPPPRSTWTTRSGSHYVINRFGDPEMGIGFESRVSVEGAWFAPQGDTGVWARAVLVRGYRDGLPVARSRSLELTNRTPTYLPMCFEDVDRIVVTASCEESGRGFFAMDDLCFGVEGHQPTTLDFEELSQRSDLTASGYGGLDWDIGSGFLAEDVHSVAAPREPRSTEPSEANAQAGAPESGPGTAPVIVRSLMGPKIFEPGNAAIPPDTNGAAGPHHYVALVNGSFNIYARFSGQRTHQIPIVRFWNAPGGLGDVRIVYDPHSSRFFALCMDGATRIYFAMSLSSDPTGAWFKTSILASQGSDAGRWPDFPTLGVDANGIYTASLMVGRGDPMTIWAIDKAPLLANPPQLGTVTAWRGKVWEGAIQPCLTFGNPGVEYLVSRRSPTELRIRRITPPLSAPTLSHVGFATIPAHSRAPSAPALGSQTGIATGDWRPSNAVFRNGFLYTSQTIEVNGRAAVRWYEIDIATTNLTQLGTIEDPVRHYFHSSLSVNRHGDLALGFSGSHAGEYVGAFFSGHAAGDPPGSAAFPQLYAAGGGPYERVDGNGTNRFGDYSLTGVDPRDDESFWTIQEFVPSAHEWGTKIAHLKFSCAAASPYGVGWPGTLGTPALTPVGLPFLGSFFALQVDNSFGQPTQAALLFSAESVSLPFLGGTLLVRPPTLAIPIAIQGSRGTLFTPIPSDRSLLWAPFYAQALVLDPGASAGMALTAGLALRVGD